MKVTFGAVRKPTVTNPLLVESYMINPESPGFAIIDDCPLINDGEAGLIVSDPEPLFLKPMNQPVDRLENIGKLNAPAPPFHTNVAARLRLLIVGEDVTATMFCVVASWPLTVVNPAPANEAASATEVPAAKVTLFQIPAAVVLSTR